MSECDYLCKFIIVILLILIYIIAYFLYENYNKIKNFKNFDYANYQKDIVTEKIIKESGWQLSLKQAYFINGIIRKFRPKNCLEIGVANGGSSILILNAIKDIKDSILISLDLNTQLYLDSTKKTGYRVKQFFFELSKNWKLFTGDMPSKFLENLNIKFDFLFLDSAHITPGEFFNIIEALPFLKENAIIILHDIMWQMYQKVKNGKLKKIGSTQNYLFSSLFGEKLIIRGNNDILNIGAVFLYKNQKDHYLEYFFLLMNYWEYMPSETQINDLKIFIKKYYQNEIYLKIFEESVLYNKNKKFKIEY